MPRQVVAQAEVMAGTAPAEAGIMLGGAALGFGAQWLVGIAGKLLHLPVAPVIIMRVALGVLLAASGWVVTRPAQGGRLMDYLAAMLGHWRRGEAPHLYGPPAPPR